MANIKQQKKRIKRAEKQRETNTRYRSTIKTLFKGLEAAEGDDAATRARDLEKLVDRAASRGALHANTAARKKSRVQRILAGTSSKASSHCVCRTCAADVLVPPDWSSPPTIRCSAPQSQKSVDVISCRLRRFTDGVCEMDSTCPRKRWVEDAHPEVRDLHRDLATLKTWCTPPTQAACLLDGVDQPSPFEEPTSHRSDRRHPGGTAAIGQAQFLDHPFGILAGGEPGFRMESKPIPGVRAGSCVGCTTRHAENVGSQSSFAPRTDYAVRLTPLASQVRYKTPPTVAAQVIAVTMHDAERHGYPMCHEEGAA